MAISQSAVKHVYLGMMARAATAASTDPREKKRESAVTRYLLLFGNCSRIIVPSVGIEPYTTHQFLMLKHGLEKRTPTALPNRKRATHRDQYEVVTAAPSPNKEVNSNVPLNAILRPSRSEPGRWTGEVSTLMCHELDHLHVPQPTAPIIIPAYIEEERTPIWPSGTKSGNLWSADRVWNWSGWADLSTDLALAAES